MLFIDDDVNKQNICFGFALFSRDKTSVFHYYIVLLTKRLTEKIICRLIDHENDQLDQAHLCGITVIEINS